MRGEEPELDSSFTGLGSAEKMIGIDKMAIAVECKLHLVGRMFLIDLFAKKVMEG